MKPEDLWNTYPVLYHIAWGGSWPNIRRKGLLSTIALLKLYRKSATEIDRLTRFHRNHWVTIECPGLPRAVVRDQKPMSDEGLQRALEGSTEPWEWYQLLNSMVFFWPTRSRLETMLGARAYKDIRHDVLVIDTKKLVDMECKSIRLSRMNSGCTKPIPHERDMDLFKRIFDYPFEERRKYGVHNALAEVCVLDKVLHIHRAVKEVKSGLSEEILASLN